MQCGTERESGSSNSPGIILAIIGGSEKVSSDTNGDDDLRVPLKKYAWGNPSHPLAVETINDRLKTVALARHGLYHELPPHLVPYRANIGALKQEGVTHILALSAVGGLDPKIEVGTILLVDQYIDCTSNRFRAKTFFEDAGAVVHCNLAEPTCRYFGDFIERAALEANIPIHRNGTLICIEGPQFSTKAELKYYRDVMKGTVIGMTTAVEAKLAREAGIHYCNLAIVTDNSTDVDQLSHEQVCQNISSITEKRTRLLKMITKLISNGEETFVAADNCCTADSLLPFTATADSARIAYIEQNKDKFDIFRW